MMFHETKLPGVFEIHLKSKPVERGFFARILVPEWAAVGRPGRYWSGIARREALHEDNIQCL